MNARAPSISILLPTYNGARYLHEQMVSILGQTWGDFELLTVDDGSSDASADIVANFLRLDPRVRSLCGAGNRGQKMRLLELYRASRGPLLAIADQDDIWESSKLERLYNAMADRALAFGRSDLIDGAGKALGMSLIERFGPVPQPGDRLRLLFTPQVSGHALLARREVITEAAFKHFQPFDWLIGLEAAFSEQGVIYVDNAVVQHRLHGENQMNGPAAKMLGKNIVARLQPHRVNDELHSTRRRRFNLVERLGFLAHSDVIDKDAKAAFIEAGSLCRAAWFDPGSAWRIKDHRLERRLGEILCPFSGSDRDWAAATDHLSDLTKAQLHPRSVYRSAVRLAFY
jgi:glycosyltransferase involved in cell wall biosynthesis